MLLNAVFYGALLALMATTVLSAGLAMTRASVHRIAQRYVASAYQAAQANVQLALASDMQSGGLPSPMPSPSPASARCVNASCTFKSTTAVAYTMVASATPSAACDPAQTNCAIAEEQNPYIGEGRLTARISVTITDSNQHPLAARTGDVTFRTLRRAPYAVAAGFRDEGFDDVASGNASGDDGGVTPATPNPCASAGPGTSDDTTIRVAYRNSVTNACSDGSILQSQSYTQQQNGAAGWSP